jgi:SPP1 family predicted phage head-tail adaptor
MNPTRAGKLRQRVQLEQLQPSESFDTFGQPIPTWTTVGTYWAEVVPLVGNEAYIARQVKAEATHKLTVRYLGANVTLNPTDHWILDGRTFGIVEVRNIEERNRRYEMTVKEIQVTGKV